MHEVQGGFCKNNNLWINRQIRRSEKKRTRAESGGPNVYMRGHWIWEDPDEDAGESGGDG